MLRRIVHTAEGLAGAVAEETRRRGGDAEVAPAGATWLAVRAPAEALAALRTVDAVLEPVRGAPTPTGPDALDRVGDFADAEPFPGLAAAASFKVRASVDAPGLDRRAVEGRVGRRLAERSGTKVDLTRPALVVWVAVGADRIWLARETAWTDPRADRPFHQRTGLRGSIAAGAVELSRLEAPEVVLDPFCGGGTVLLEAAARHPEAQLWGGDWIARAADGARANLAAVGAGDRSRIRHADARDLVADHPAGSVDALLTNPPFGVQVGARIKFHGFYAHLLSAARHVLRPGGRLTLFTDRRNTFEAALRQVGGFEPFAEARVHAGGLTPWILSLSRR